MYLASKFGHNVEVFPAVQVTVYSSATSEFKFTEKQTLWPEATPTKI